MGGGGPENGIPAMIAFLGDGNSEHPQLYVEGKDTNTPGNAGSLGRFLACIAWMLRRGAVPQDLMRPGQRPCEFCAANRNRKNEKTTVEFGRTEVSIRPFRSCLFRDLQGGHGFMATGFKN